MMAKDEETFEFNQAGKGIECVRTVTWAYVTGATTQPTLIQQLVLSAERRDLVMKKQPGIEERATK